MRKRPLTAREVRLIGRLYPTRTLREVCDRVGRCASVVFACAKRLGIVKLPRHNPAMLDRVRDLHATGLPDRVIGEQLGLRRLQVRGLRERLGLKSHFDVEAHQRSIAGQCRTLGIRPGGDLRRLGFERFATDRGWPHDLPPRSVLILEMLAAHQPCTRHQLADLCGVRWKGRNTFTARCEGGSYLSLLLRRGLVVYQHRSKPSGRQGHGRIPGLYWLTMAAMEVIQKRSEEKP